jgi:hypothetical protein
MPIADALIEVAALIKRLLIDLVSPIGATIGVVALLLSGRGAQRPAPSGNPTSEQGSLRPTTDDDPSGGLSQERQLLAVPSSEGGSSGPATASSFIASHPLHERAKGLKLSVEGQQDIDVLDIDPSGCHLRIGFNLARVEDLMNTLPSQLTFGRIRLHLIPSGFSGSIQSSM